MVVAAVLLRFVYRRPDTRLFPLASAAAPLVSTPPNSATGYPGAPVCVYQLNVLPPPFSLPFSHILTF